jgi:hypothetical protein
MAGISKAARPGNVTYTIRGEARIAHELSSMVEPRFQQHRSKRGPALRENAVKMPL